MCFVSKTSLENTKLVLTGHLWRSKKICSVFRVHGTNLDRLGLTVSKQKSVLKKKHQFRRYCSKYVKKPIYLHPLSDRSWLTAYFLNQLVHWNCESKLVKKSTINPVNRTIFLTFKGALLILFNNTDSLIFVSINRIHLRFSDFPTFSIFNPP